ncbi:uncharacterized protein LAESUDRAFT_724010 [Laetiporus sulphureus 93-53]|uniref:Uncharacterized protein n=1 Tax=Laetiporus sulphureus 93-53 TaxID=1314785 RepID=A0A165F6X0_9APHY|nr:uncharacterized protein LAESUDRAFT_724010 [Laetiporus sulphureus 93-53]KZT08504.1 hypothetical protein LAESUDRAFT_724010 [Laetiporus sulphureus 93-53]
MVTLLIHDRRGDEPMEILVEVYVPLRMDDEPAVGYWADAEEVSHELQRGPSRIDGRAKLYCMRGKYRQYIMRVTCGGAIKCHTANLLITKQRTLDIYVEDAPHDCDNECVAAHMAELAGSPPHYEREMLTPVTESMLSPTSEVMILDEDDLESVSQPSSSRKRRRSTSTHSDAPDLRHSSHRASPSGPHRPSPIPQEQPMMLTPSTTQTSAASQDSHNAHVPSPSPPQAGASHENSQFLPTPSSSQSSPSEEELYESSRSSSSSESDSLPPNKVRRLDGSRDVSPAQNVSFPMSHSRAVQEELQAAPAAALAAQPPALATPPPAPANPFLRSSFARFATSLGVSNTQTRMSGDPFPKTSTLPSAGLNPISPASEQDNAVSMHLRSLILEDPAWEKFRIGRQHNLTMSQQMQQYEYVKSMFDKYVSKYTPADLKGAPGVQITKSHVMRAFNLPDKWGEEGMEMLTLTALYGPGGKCCEDANVIAMMEERHPIATKMQVEKFLKLLRETHSRWTLEHPDLLQ